MEHEPLGMSNQFTKKCKNNTILSLFTFYIPGVNFINNLCVLFLKIFLRKKVMKPKRK